MTRLMQPSFRSFTIALALGGGAIWSIPSVAQSAPPTDAAPPTASDTIRLTDEQRNKILDENTEDSAAAARGELTSSERTARGIHGEVGVMIGSYGSHGAYGVANIPLGDNAAATVAVESSTIRYKR